MARKKIEAKSRNIADNTKRLVESGFLPAVAYDQEANSTSIQIDFGDAIKIVSETTPTTIYNLEIDGKENLALIKEIQNDIRKGTIHHISFMILNPDAMVDISLDVIAKGVCPAVRNNLGVLIFVHDSLELRGYPKDIPEKIEVDVTGLKDVGDSIRVEDVNIPTELEFVHDEDKNLTLATITPFQKVSEVEEKAAIEGEEEIDAEPTEGEDEEGVEEKTEAK